MKSTQCHITLYRMLCAHTDDIPLFAQAWWLDAVASAQGKTWDVLLSIDEQGEVQGAMPYVLSRKLGMRFMLLPQQTQFTYIWTEQVDDAQRAEIYRDLIRQIDEIAPTYCCLNLPHTDPHQALFAQAKYQVSERYTYRINDLSEPFALIQSRFSQNKKRHLKKAKNMQLDLSMSADEFYAFHEQCLAGRGKRIVYPHHLLDAIYKAVQRHKAGQIIAVRNMQNEMMAAVLLVWDSASTYFLVPCYDEQFKNTGAMTWLTSQVIQFAKSRSRSFDFEGSMVPSIANSYRQFGTVKTTYWKIEKFYNPIFKLIWKTFTNFATI